MNAGANERRAPFFSLNAEYAIVPGASPSALLDDASCFLDAVLGLCQSDPPEQMTSAQFARLYLLEQAIAALSEAAQLVVMNERAAATDGRIVVTALQACRHESGAQRQPQGATS